MITLALTLAVALAGLLGSAQLDRTEDHRAEQPKGYHIISHPVRTGETPPDVKREKADDDRNRQRRSDREITDQTPPTRQPELKPKSIQP